MFDRLKSNLMQERIVTVLEYQYDPKIPPGLLRTSVKCASFHSVHFPHQSLYSVAIHRTRNSFLRHCKAHSDSNTIRTPGKRKKMT